MNTQVITRADAVLRMLDTKGKFFSVTFTKRTTGEKREMTCRLKVTKHLKGGKRKYNPFQKGLITVFDMAKESYRNINVNTVEKVVIGGQEFVVADHPRILIVGVNL